MIPKPEKAADHFSASSRSFFHGVSSKKINLMTLILMVGLRTCCAIRTVPECRFCIRTYPMHPPDFHMWRRVRRQAHEGFPALLRLIIAQVPERCKQENRRTITGTTNNIYSSV